MIPRDIYGVEWGKKKTIYKLTYDLIEINNNK